MYNNRIGNLASGVAYVGSRTGEGRAQAAGADGRGSGDGGQDRDVTPGAWLAAADGRTDGYKSSRRRAA